jgi:hypothetical protein
VIGELEQARIAAASRSSIDSRCFIAITTACGADAHVLVAGVGRFLPT